MDALTRRLAERTLELVNIPSVSREEAELAEHVAGLVPEPFELLYRADDCLYFATPRREGRPLVVLAGHLDTVPAQGNLPGRLEGDAVWGLGASDMKAGVAVMVELARWVGEEAPDTAVDLGLVLFGKEELSIQESPLPGLFDACDAVSEADLVVVMEPTDCTLQPGCLGHLRALVVFDGEAGHSARPWLARNAIDAAVSGLAPIVGHEPRGVEIDGLRFVEVVSVTQIHGGVATNVIPDRVECTVSFRYPPDRTPEEAEAHLRGLLDGAGRLEEIANSPSARVVTDTPLVRRLREAGGFEIQPKQAWTPVAEFAARGLDAINLGPGHTRLAHSADEHVRADALVRVYTALQRFLSG